VEKYLTGQWTPKGGRHMIQQFHTYGYAQRNVSQVTIKAPAHPWSIAALFTIAKV
jgi:hypothetical protein